VATKTVKVSELTEEEIGSEEQLARLVVEQHPDLPGSVTLEVLPEEVESKFPEEQNFVSVTYYPPTTAQRYLMTVEDFKKLARDEDMATVLQNALRTQQEEEGSRRGRREGQRRQRVDYTSPEHAGEAPNQQTEHGDETILSQQLDTLLKNSLSSFTQVTNESVSERAKAWPVILPLAVGLVMIGFAIFLKLGFVGQEPGNLSSSEFVTVVLTGAMLVVLGGLIHLYQYRASHELRMRIQDTAETTLDAQIQASEKVMESELLRQQKPDDEQMARQWQQWFQAVYAKLTGSSHETKEGTSQEAK